MSEWPYIIAAYGVSWFVLVGFAFYLMTRDRGARRRARGESRP